MEMISKIWETRLGGPSSDAQNVSARYLFMARPYRDHDILPLVSLRTAAVAQRERTSSVSPQARLAMPNAAKPTR
jgi:hypothetical protein